MIVRSLILWAVLILTGAGLQAQSFTFKTSGMSLEVVLAELEKAYDVHFSFDPGLLEDKSVSGNFKAKDLDDLLAQIMEPYDIKVQPSDAGFYYLTNPYVRLKLNIRDTAGAPVAFAIVRIKNSNRGVYANDDGKAGLKLLKEENPTLVIQSLGFKPIELSFQEALQQPNITLKHNIQELKEFGKHEYINKAIRLNDDFSNITLNPNEMEILPGLPEPDVLLSVQMLPGVESDNETASGINIRGSGQDQVLVYWDRIPIYHKSHYFGSITSFIPSTVNKITTYKNYIPTAYSGATSGLLDIHVFDSIKERFNAISNTTFTHTDLTLSSRLTKGLSVIVGGRTSYNHIWQTPAFNAYSNKLFEGTRVFDALDDVADDENEEPNTQINSQLLFNDLNFKLIFHPNKKHYFSATGIVSSDGLNLDIFEREDSLSTEQVHTINSSGFNGYYAFRPNDKLQLNTSLSYTSFLMTDNQHLFIDEVQRTLIDSIAVENSLSNLEFKVGGTFQLKKSLALNAGYQFNEIQNGLIYAERNEFEPLWTETFNTSEMAHGVYFGADFENDRLLLQPQVRFDYYTSEEEVIVNPVVHAQYKLSDRIRIKGAYGQYAQTVRALNETGIEVSNVQSNIWLIAGDNDDVEIVESRHGNVGVILNHNGWIFDWDVYAKEVEGISSINLFSEEVSSSLDFSSGNANIYGTDVMLKKRFGRFSSWVSYSYSINRNNFVEFQDEAFFSSLDRPHQLRLVNSFHYNALEFSLGWVYKSGAPYTQVTGLNYDPIEDDYSMAYGTINGNRLDAYHRLDFSMWYKLYNDQSKVKGTVGVSLLNVYNRDNIWQRFYFLDNFDDNDVPEVIEEEKFFLGFTPNVTIKLFLN